MNEIDKQAEREAQAIRRLREDDSTRRMGNKHKRIRQQTEYNKQEFDRLFYVK